LDFDAYQHGAARTLNPSLSPDQRLLDAAAGLSEEAGEILGLVRKHLFQGHPLDRNALVKELGDALWCVSAMATSLHVSLGETAAANLDKLRKRYPDGYTDSASLSRLDEDS
jgi:NTP pyrophosphatase (non-canonical NTP hydrolase)